MDSFIPIVQKPNVPFIPTDKEISTPTGKGGM